MSDNQQSQSSLVVRISLRVELSQLTRLLATLLPVLLFLARVVYALRSHQPP